jgi:hypothetical protein
LDGETGGVEGYGCTTVLPVGRQPLRSSGEVRPKSSKLRKYETEKAEEKYIVQLLRVIFCTIWFPEAATSCFADHTVEPERNYQKNAAATMAFFKKPLFHPQMLPCSVSRQRGWG